MLITMADRCIGSSHIKQNKPLQDYAAATSDRLKSYAYALVADGHGGDKYIRSAKGSELAVRCAVDSINGVLKEILWDVPMLSKHAFNWNKLDFKKFFLCIEHKFLSFFFIFASKSS